MILYKFESYNILIYFYVNVRSFILFIMVDLNKILFNVRKSQEIIKNLTKCTKISVYV